MFQKKFIRAPYPKRSLEHPQNAPYFRKTFDLETVPESAKITVCGLGFYEIYVNGSPMTKGILAPYISNSDDVCYFDEYDITAALKPGKNCVAFLLGNGMQNCEGGITWNFQNAPFTSEVKLAFAMSLRAGETETVLLADETVRTARSPITLDDLRFGCHYDARLEIENWNLPEFDDSGWDAALPAELPRGEFRLCTAEPIRCHWEIRAVSVRKGELARDYRNAQENKYPDLPPQPEEAFHGVIYDFGENAAGLPLLTLHHTTRGQVIGLQHSEFCNPDGKISYANCNFYPDGYVQKDVYICKGGETEVFEPKFTYHGFRYCFVTGLREDQIAEDTVIYRVYHSDFSSRGEFSCSDETLNTLQQMVRRSDLSNFYYFPTDCPQREKNGWTGDVFVSSEQFLLNFRAEKSLKEWMRTVRAAQNAEGAIPGIVPTGGWGFSWGNGPIWDNVLTEVPYEIFRYSGDREALQEAASSIFRYLFYARQKLNRRGLLAYGLGEWVKIQSDLPVPTKEFVDSVMIVEFCRKAQKIFDMLGMLSESRYAAELETGLADALREHLIDHQRVIADNGAHTAQALAIWFDLFSEKEMPMAGEQLVRMIHDNHDMADIGMTGARYLFHALWKIGQTDLAVRLIRDSRDGCYGSFVRHGFTTLPERFDHVVNDDGTCYAYASYNHHFLGDISHFFYSRIAGICVNENLDGANRVDLRPDFVESLDFAKARYEAPDGAVSVYWEKTEAGVTLSVESTGAVFGEIQLPGGYVFADGQSRKELLAGNYEVKKQ